MAVISDGMGHSSENICEILNRKGTYVGVNMNILGCACVSISLSDLELPE